MEDKESQRMWRDENKIEKEKNSREKIGDAIEANRREGMTTGVRMGNIEKGKKTKKM